MSGDNTSQSTEEALLDQTFADYNDGMTAQTENPQTSDGDDKKSTPKKKSNQNAIVGGVVGCVAVGMVAYMVLAPKVTGGQVKNSSNQMAQSAPTSSPTQEASPAQNAILTGETDLGSNDGAIGGLDKNPMVESVDVDDMKDTLAVKDINDGVLSSQDDFSSSVSASSSGAGAGVVVKADEPAKSVSTVVEQKTVTVEQKPATNNMVQQELVAQLKVMFAEQTKEIKTSVDAVGSRVTDLEKVVSEQKDVNKSIEDRLARLEAGKPTLVAKVKNPSVSTQVSSVDVSDEKPATVKKAKKHFARKNVVKKQVNVAAVESAEYSYGPSVLVDKTNGKYSAPVKEVVKPVLVDIKIHSIYAGRVWIKNDDGSLSTYSAGEKLPDGEVIKSIDSDNLTISTNKRTLK